MVSVSITFNFLYIFQKFFQEKLAKQKPRLDYSDVFDDVIGSCDNLWMWEIENFYPALIDPREHGQFYEADSYLILKTTREPSGSLTHAIYYWIGEKTSLDKGFSIGHFCTLYQVRVRGTNFGKSILVLSDFAP
uniref:Gelsolin-like domain-containing protein n=1 Tax=Meloidogyne incognita TaxID=6306 RepID=A0A914MVP6_MELIC